jgi:DNA-binding Xre family transcriptional regulator
MSAVLSGCLSLVVWYHRFVILDTVMSLWYNLRAYSKVYLVGYIGMRIRLLVRQVAESRGYTAPQLARKADVSNDTIYRIWHNEYASISTAILAKIADALEVSITDLLEEQRE